MVKGALFVMNLSLARTPRWWWTSSPACVEQPKVLFHTFSKCAKVGKNFVSRLSPCISSKNCAFSPGTQDRRNALQLLHLPNVELVRDTYGPSTVLGAGLGCKIERRQLMHTEARLGWHTCASDPLLVVLSSNRTTNYNCLNYCIGWTQTWTCPCVLHEQKSESKN